jgi:hypothetical protein
VNQCLFIFVASSVIVHFYSFCFAFGQFALLDYSVLNYCNRLSHWQISLPFNRCKILPPMCAYCDSRLSTTTHSSFLSCSIGPGQNQSSTPKEAIFHFSRWCMIWGWDQVGKRLKIMQIWVHWKYSAVRATYSTNGKREIRMCKADSGWLECDNIDFDWSESEKNNWRPERGHWKVVSVYAVTQKKCLLASFKIWLPEEFQRLIKKLNGNFCYNF